MGIPSGANLHSSLVFAKSDRRNEIHERRGVGIAHVVADGCGIIGCIFLVGVPEKERELHGLIRKRRGGLEF
jgi:hypothetical protein